MTTIEKPRMKDIVLQSGGHSTREQGLCVMELAAWLAGREHSDRPPCVDPAIAGFLRAWNDSLDDADRQKLKPYAKKVLKTTTSAADTRTRGWMATDWLVREFTPAWLSSSLSAPFVQGLSRGCWSGTVGGNTMSARESLIEYGPRRVK